MLSEEEPELEQEEVLELEEEQEKEEEKGVEPKEEDDPFSLRNAERKKLAEAVRSPSHPAFLPSELY